MSLSDKIKKIINVIQGTDIEEIEISSFWGAQKIKLSKKSSLDNSPVYIEPKKFSNEEVLDIPKDENSSSLKEKEESTIDELDDSSVSNDDTSAINEEDLEYQKAPLVGTFYASSKPGEAPFVSVGEKVSKGQTICIIEAMKIFNEIESDFDGTIIEVLAEDANPVEFNQSIFSIKPNE
tara:strand:- start:1011 stop:1547 length:537 start_codon:yes stop_codon:yes gene_type:complete